MPSDDGGEKALTILSKGTVAACAKHSQTVDPHISHSCFRGLFLFSEGTFNGPNQKKEVPQGELSLAALGQGTLLQKYITGKRRTQGALSYAHGISYWDRRILLSANLAFKYIIQ